MEIVKYILFGSINLCIPKDTSIYPSEPTVSFLYEYFCTHTHSSNQHTPAS